MLQEQLINAIKSRLTEAISFIAETAVDVTLSEPRIDRKVANTEYVTVEGEYAAGQLFGKISLSLTNSGDNAKPLKLTMSFGDEKPTEISITGPDAMYDSLLAKHKLYVERSRTRSTAFTVNDALIELEQLQCDPETHKKIMEIIEKIR